MLIERLLCVYVLAMRTIMGYSVNRFTWRIKIVPFLKGRQNSLA